MRMCIYHIYIYMNGLYVYFSKGIISYIHHVLHVKHMKHDVSHSEFIFVYTRLVTSV